MPPLRFQSLPTPRKTEANFAHFHTRHDTTRNARDVFVTSRPNKHNLTLHRGQASSLCVQGQSICGVDVGVKGTGLEWPVHILGQARRQFGLFLCITLLVRDCKMASERELRNSIEYLPVCR
jgi:hypothetical protein